MDRPMSNRTKVFFCYRRNPNDPQGQIIRLDTFIRRLQERGFYFINISNGEFAFRFEAIVV
jgi:hypothetical protein